MSSKGSPNRVKLNVGFVTFSNDDVLIGNILDSKKTSPTFVLTTGCFPHEIVFITCASSADISSIRFVLQDAKDIVLECSDQRLGPFTTLLTRTLERGALVKCVPKRQRDEAEDRNSDLSSTKPALDAESSSEVVIYGTQTEALDVAPHANGKGIQTLRLRILSGYSDFVAISQFEVWGEESEQRIAVLECKPEFTL